VTRGDEEGADGRGGRSKASLERKGAPTFSRTPCGRISMRNATRRPCYPDVAADGRRGPCSSRTPRRRPPEIPLRAILQKKKGSSVVTFYRRCVLARPEAIDRRSHSAASRQTAGARTVKVYPFGPSWDRAFEEAARGLGSFRLPIGGGETRRGRRRHNPLKNLPPQRNSRALRNAESQGIPIYKSLRLQTRLPQISPKLHSHR